MLCALTLLVSQAMASVTGDVGFVPSSDLNCGISNRLRAMV